MARAYCPITGVPEASAVPALGEWPLVPWSGEIDRAVREFVERTGPWTLDASRPNRYQAVWTREGRWGVSPTRVLSTATVRWLERGMESLTSRACAGLGLKRLHADAVQGVFLFEVDWYHPRWQPVPCDGVERWCAPFLALLDDLRASGVCHGGICPSALAVDPDGGEVRLRGFPFAHVICDARRALAPGLGELVGDPLFVAPEVAAGERPDAVSDIYSLGASLLTIAGMTRGHDWRGPYAGVAGMTRRMALVQEDWLMEGAPVVPTLLGMLEPNPELRACMLPRCTGSKTVDEEAVDRYLRYALDRAHVQISDDESAWEIFMEIVDAARRNSG